MVTRYPPPVAYDFDLVVLGGGPAGEKGAVQAAYFKKKVAIIEREAEPGGAAVHTGTLPSKTLRETSLFLSGHQARDLYGVDVEIDRVKAPPRLLARTDAVRGLEVARIWWNLNRHDVTVLRGHARFVDPRTVEVAGRDGSTRRITAEYFLVATGSVPFRPAGIDFDDPDIEDSDTILRLSKLPRSLTVLGAGVIGCEYATIFAAMGVEVQIVEPRSAILPFLDPEIGERLSKAMERLGIHVLLGDGYETVRRDGARGIVTTLKSGKVLVSEQLLFAAGRNGNTRSLGLADIGVQVVEPRGYITVDEDYRTSVPHVFAAGDCIGFPSLASTSMEQARVAVCRAFGFAYKKQVSELLPYGIYTIPEVSCVGLTEDQVTERGQTPIVGRAFYLNNARGKIIGDKDGVVKLVFDFESRKLLGCHCIGDRATELVHIGQAVIMLGGTAETFIEMVFNYPTLAEIFKYAAYDALGRWAGHRLTNLPPISVTTRSS